MIKAILKYIPLAVVDIVADFLAILLSPIAALFYEKKEGREYLKPFWKWTTTHDAPVDAGRVDGYFKVSDNSWGRYVSRVKWIFRNPAYQVSHWLGYDQTGVDTTKGLYKDPLWDSGVPNKAFWKVKNSKGQVGFLYQQQWYYYKNYCVEMQFGWKLYRRDPDKKCMIAFRFSPFKKYYVKNLD